MTNMSRELDALVAEKVMGLPCLDIPPSDGRDCPRCGCPSYSIDIAAAWEVVEKMEACPYPHGAEIGSAYVDGLDGYIVAFGRGGPEPIDVAEFAVTAPLAICRAALKAVDA